MLDVNTSPAQTTMPNTAPLSTTPTHATLNVKLVLGLLNACFGIIERSAWQLRNLANQTQEGWQWLANETETLWQSTRRLPARLQRLSRCGWMLTRLITSYRLWPTKSAFIPSAKQEAALAQLHRKSAQLFVETSLTQGGAFLKIGQLLSSRSDLLPPVWIEELSRLQDQALPESPSAIRKAVEVALGQPAAQIFAKFDDTPLACASIGQVHKATLKDGRVVAVKVQRSDIAGLIETDLLLLGLFLRNTDSLLPGMDLATIFGEIRRSLREELDYRREAAAMRRVARHLDKIDGVSCPAVIEALSSERLLVTEFVEGRKLTQALDTYLQQQDSAKTAQLMTRLLDAWLLQVLQLGFFHADPHPGNLLVTADNRLVLLDFGACQSLPDNVRAGYLRILQASIVGDDATLTATLAELGFKTQSGQPDTLLAFTHALLTQLTERLASQVDGAAIWPDEDELLSQGKELLARLQDDPVVQLPPHFIMLARVFLSLGGLFIRYRPAMNLPALMLKHLTWQQQAAA